MVAWKWMRSLPFLAGAQHLRRRAQHSPGFRSGFSLSGVAACGAGGLARGHSAAVSRLRRPPARLATCLNQIFREKKRKTPQTPQHQAQLYLKLAQFAGAGIEGALAERPVRRAPSSVGQRIPRFAVCPGAQVGGAERWLPEGFAEVMTRVAAARPCTWVLVGVGRDAAIGEEITKSFQGTVRDLIGKTTMLELIAELRECDQLLTNDTRDHAPRRLSLVCLWWRFSAPRSRRSAARSARGIGSSARRRPPAPVSGAPARSIFPASTPLPWKWSPRRSLLRPWEKPEMRQPSRSGRAGALLKAW